jgi:hypothetical protein
VRSRRAALLAVPALALALTPVHADAAAYRWKGIVYIGGGVLQICKIPTTDTGPWKVKVRVNARQATTRLKGEASAYKNGSRIGTPWESAWIYPGDVSGIGTVKLPRGSAYGFQGIVRTGTGGGGASSIRARDIPRC